ncbi:MAG: SPASM domain-containing protein [Theionarchaea archaeon]|nr:SPASM domain-containing protein [Theionarchaea archaeon]
MKSSKYNLYISLCGPKYVVYNTLHGSITFVDEEMKSALESNQLQNVDDTSKNQLYAQGILVEKNTDELSQYRHVFLKEMYAPSYASITVFPTYACNLSCHYCYQKWSDAPKASMTESVLTNTMAFLKSQLAADNPRALLVKVFGGEPLVHPQATKTLLAGLHEWADSQRIQFFGTLTTNGTLFTGELFEALSPHLGAVHITLDGPQPLHDSIRYYSKGNGTYEDIMHSLSLLSKTSIRVCLRINVHDNDYETTTLLLQDIKERGFSRCPNFELDFGLIVQKDTCDVGLNEEEYIAGKEIAVASVQYIQKMLNHVGWENPQNVRYPDNVRMDNPPVLCDQTKRKRYIIDSFGDIYLCPSKAGEKEYRVGQIGEGGRVTWNNDFYTILTRHPADFEECSSCAYLPVCGGGCAIHAREKNGDYRTSFCGAVKTITAQKVLSYVERYYPNRIE